MNVIAGFFYNRESKEAKSLNLLLPHLFLSLMSFDFLHCGNFRHHAKSSSRTRVLPGQVHQVG
jgi:hypothetical protein